MSEPSASAVHVDGQTRVARRLKNLRYRRIDLVDKGASHDVASGEGAHVVLFKRAEPTPQPGTIKKYLDAALAKMATFFEGIAKGEPLTFEEAQMVRGSDDVYEDLYDNLGALWSAVSSALYSDAPNKAAAIKTAVQAYCADLAADFDEWLSTGGDDDVSLAKRAEVRKAGRKISSERLGRLQAMHKTLGEFIAEHDAKPAEAGDKGGKVMKTVDGAPGPAGPAAPAAPASPAAPAAAAPVASALPADVQKRLDEAAAENVALKKRLDDAEAAVNIEKDARLTAKYVAKCAIFKGLPVKADDDHKVFREIDEKLSPEVAKRVNELLAAGDAAFVQAGLFKAVGSGHPGGDVGSAFAEIERLAEAEVAKGAGMTKAQAIDKITRAHPELYKRHLEAQGRITA